MYRYSLPCTYNCIHHILIACLSKLYHVPTSKNLSFRWTANTVITKFTFNLLNLVSINYLFHEPDILSHSRENENEQILVLTFGKITHNRYKSVHKYAV